MRRWHEQERITEGDLVIITASRRMAIQMKDYGEFDIEWEGEIRSFPVVQWEMRYDQFSDQCADYYRLNNGIEVVVFSPPSLLDKLFGKRVVRA